MGSGLQGDGRGLWHDLPEGIEKTGMVEGVDRQVCRGGLLSDLLLSHVGVLFCLRVALAGDGLCRFH